MRKIRSRIHEFICEELMLELDKVCNNVVVSDNNVKAMRIKLLLDKYDVFYNELGPGTNRLAVLIDGYVFKIAMDKWGKQDNANEFAMSKELQPYVIKVYENNDLISVSEYVTLVTREEFIEKKVQFLKILSILSESYLLGDVGYVEKNFTNWGYRDNGELVILDFAYIHNIHGEELFCPQDGSMIEYDLNFDKLKCPSCGKRFTFIDIRRKIHNDEEWEFINSVKNQSYRLTTSHIIINDKSEQTDNIKKEELNMREEQDVFNEETIEKGYKSALEKLRARAAGEEVEPTISEPVEPDYEEPCVEEEDDEEDGINPLEAFRQANADKHFAEPDEIFVEEESDEEEDGPTDFEAMLDSLDYSQASESVEVKGSIAAVASVLTGSADVDSVQVTRVTTITEEVEATVTHSTSEDVEESDEVMEEQVEESTKAIEDEVVLHNVVEVETPDSVKVEEPTVVENTETSQDVEVVKTENEGQTSKIADLMMRAHQQNSRKGTVSIRVSKPTQETEQEKYERLARENGYNED